MTCSTKTDWKTSPPSTSAGKWLFDRAFLFALAIFLILGIASKIEDALLYKGMGSWAGEVGTYAPWDPEHPDYRASDWPPQTGF